jgi:LysM repeat protein
LNVASGDPRREEANLAREVAPRSDHGGVEPDDRRYVAYLIFGGLALLLLVIIVVGVTSYGVDDEDAQATSARAERLSRLPVYWKVHSGDTYDQIAQKTGLTVDELETFNPYIDPSRIQPGQRLKLRAKVPPPKPKPLGPKYVTVHTGDSYGSIAAKTGKDITRLQRLNPKLKATELHPGDRVRLR